MLYIQHRQKVYFAKVVYIQGFIYETKRKVKINWTEEGREKGKRKMGWGLAILTLYLFYIRASIKFIFMVVRFTSV